MTTIITSITITLWLLLLLPVLLFIVFDIRILCQDCEAARHLARQTRGRAGGQAARQPAAGGPASPAQPIVVIVRFTSISTTTMITIIIIISSINTIITIIIIIVTTIVNSARLAPGGLAEATGGSGAYDDEARRW